MFNKKTPQPKTPTRLEEAIEEIYDSMAGVMPDTEEYNKYTTQLERLLNLKSNEQTSDKNSTTLKDWLPVIASVGSVGLIIVYESLGNTITSKALSFTPKMKL